MAHPIRTEPRRRIAASTRPSWAVVGSAMTRHLDWLEENAGRPAIRDLVDGALGRLEHQLRRLESGATGGKLLSAATALRDCGALLGNATLTRYATTLLDGAESPPDRIRFLSERLLSEGRRTSSWLRIWRALATPAHTTDLLARSARGAASPVAAGA